MIERLNFYDLYGYLLPGLLWLALMWLPFGVAYQHWPPAEWPSALVALVLGYISGHVLQGLAIRALPSTIRGANGDSRYPSDVLLDDQDETFSPEVKSRLLNRILLNFGIDVSSAKNPDPGVRRKRRQDAFMMCRRTLIQKGIASYAEQFEGMYALMRGVTASCVLSTTYHLGWALATYIPVPFKEVLSYLALLGLVVVLLKCRSTYAFWLVTGLLFVYGGLFGVGKVVGVEMFFLFFSVSLVSLVVSFMCYDAYQQFSRYFAQTVYRDFCAL